MYKVTMKIKTLNDSRVQVAGCTDIGNVREENQDNYLIMPLAAPTGVAGVLVVADGMGGHKGGAVASKLAVECVKKSFSSPDDEIGDNDDKNKFLKLAVEEANSEVYKGGFTPENMGMGTTLTVIQINENGEYGLGHVGDSRAYLIRNGTMDRISTDHSLVGEQVMAGMITEEEARIHPQRNVITRAIGLNEDVEPDVNNGLLMDGDILVLCSDGLHGLVSDHEIQSTVIGNIPKRAVDRLVSLANEAGGHDNITVIVARFGKANPKLTNKVVNKFSWMSVFWKFIRRFFRT